MELRIRASRSTLASLLGLCLLLLPRCDAQATIGAAAMPTTVTTGVGRAISDPQSPPPRRVTGLPSHHVVRLHRPPLPGRPVRRAEPPRPLVVRVTLRPRPAAWRALPSRPAGRLPVHNLRAAGAPGRPLWVQGATDGRHTGLIVGFSATAISLWTGSRILEVRLRPTSWPTVNGRHASVWALRAGDRAVVTVRGGSIIHLSDLSATRAPTVNRSVGRGQWGMSGAARPGRPATQGGPGSRLRPSVSLVAPVSDTWTQTNGPPLGVRGLAFDPNNPGTLWVGSDSSLYESQDSGQTWTARSGHAIRLAADPTTSNILYRSSGSFLEKSTDGGATWATIGSIGTDCVDRGTTISVNPAQPTTILVGGGCAGGSIHRSADGGQTFTTVASYSLGPVTTFAFDPVSPAVVYGAVMGVGVVRSTNYGLTWSTPSAQPADRGVQALVATTTGGHVEQSPDGGQTWNDISGTGAGQLPGIDLITVAHDPASGYLYAGEYVIAGGLYRSTDNGATWTADPGGAGGSIGSSSIGYLAASGGAMWAGGDGLFRSADNGATWPQRDNKVTDGTQNLSIGPDGALYDSHSPAGSRKSVDHGQSWACACQVGLTPGPVLGSDWTVFPAPSNPNHLYTPSGYNSTNEYTSTTGGGYWVSASTGPPQPDILSRFGPPWQAVDPLDEKTVWTTSTQGLYVSHDNAATWVTTGLSSTQVTAVVVVSTTPRLLYATVPTGQPLAAGVWKSGDGGATWSLLNGTQSSTDPTGLTLDPTTAQSTGPTLYVGTSQGELKSVDGGAHWAVLNGATNGLPAQQSFTAVAIDPAYPLLLLGARGNVLHSSDGGATWSDSAMPLSSQRIVADPTQGNVFYADSPRGVYQDATNPLLLGATAPDALAPDGHGGYQDNPFTVTAHVTDTAVLALSNVSVTLTLAPGLSFTPGVNTTTQTALTVPITTLLGSAVVGFGVWAAPVLSTATAAYTLTASSSTATTSPLTLTGTILLPASMTSGLVPWHPHFRAPLSDRLSIQVDLADGHASVQSADLSIPARGPDLTLGHVWDSVAAATGVTTTAGQGWFDNVTPSMGGVLTQTVALTDASGQVWPFTYGGALTASAPYTTYVGPPGLPWQLWATNAPGATVGYSLTNFLTGAVLTFDRQGRLLGQADAYTNQNSVAYAGSLPISLTNNGGPGGIGRALVLTYTNGLLSAVQSPLWQSGGTSKAASQQVGYGYVGAQLVTQTWGLGTAQALTATYGYNGSQMVAITTPVGQRWSLAYDTLGRVLSLTSPVSGTAGQAGYTPAYSTQFTYTPNQTQVVEGAGTTGALTTTYTFDAQGQPLVIADGLNERTTYTYDNAHDVLTRTDANQHTVRHDYTYVGPGGLVGLITQTVGPAIAPYLLGSALQPVTSTYQYDTNNNLVQVNTNNGNEIHYAYDVGHQVITTTQLLDVRSTNCAPIHPHTHPRLRPHTCNLLYEWRLGTNSYDSAGQLTSTVDPRGYIMAPTNSDSPPDPLQSAAYPQSVHSYTYTLSGDLSQASTPPITTSVQSNRPVTETYFYDGDGNRTAIQSRNGALALAGYDHLGRFIGQQGAGFNPWYSATTTVTPALALGYDGDGRVISTTDALLETTGYSYDPLGRLIDQVSPVQATTLYTYTATNLSAVRDPVGNVTSYGYDPAGRLVARTDGAGVTQRYGYDAVGNTTGITTPLDANRPSALSVERRSYDALDEVVTDTIGGVGEITPTGTLTRTYTYDLHGNVVQEQAPNGDVGYTRSDLADRVGQVNVQVGPTPAVRAGAGGPERLDLGPGEQPHRLPRFRPARAPRPLRRGRPAEQPDRHPALPELSPGAANRHRRHRRPRRQRADPDPRGSGHHDGDLGRGVQRGRLADLAERRRGPGGLRLRPGRPAALRDGAGDHGQRVDGGGRGGAGHGDQRHAGRPALPAEHHRLLPDRPAVHDYPRCRRREWRPGERGAPVRRRQPRDAGAGGVAGTPAGLELRLQL